MKKLSRFWHELKRRKVLSFFIGYVGATFAIVEFLSFSSSRFNLSDNFFDFLYLFAAIGIPPVLILPWIINRKSNSGEVSLLPKPISEAKKKLMHNLPAKVTAFIGRAKETEQVRALIREHRILTITGSGGCGKTRLACEAAEGLVDNYSDGVWFVDLAPVLTEDLVTRQLADVLKVNEEPGRDISDSLIQQTKDKNLLIILDNCEHLISACSVLSGTLVKAIPGLQIITTSREALKIAGEKVWRIPSLSLLDPESEVTLDKALSSEAVQLYMNRALLIDPTFELTEQNARDVAGICHKLEGIPLAIEIVASRSGQMSPRLIQERLSDRFDQLLSRDVLKPDRQKTLYATIEWGYNLLSDEERLLFNSLSVFTGSFDLIAAEHVASNELLPESHILDLISNLVDKSMIQMVQNADQTMDYSLFDSLRHFGLQKLQSIDQEQNTRERHMQYYLHITGEANAERNTSQSKWLKKLEKEHDNLISALEWSDRYAHEDFMHLSGNLAWFWVWQSHFKTGIYYLGKSQSKGHQHTESYARVLAGTGTISLFSGDAIRAVRLLEESTRLWSELKNPKEQAITSNELALTYCMMGDNETGLKIGKQSLDLANETRDPGTINHCKGSLCQAMVSLKQIDEVRPLAEQMIIASKELDQPLMMRLGYHFVADCDLMSGRFKEAEKNYGQALSAARESGNTLFVCIELIGLAMSVSGQLRHAKTMRLAAASRVFTSKAGYIDPERMQLEFWAELVNIYITRVREELGEELILKYEEEGILLDIDEAIEYALDFDKD